LEKKSVTETESKTQHRVREDIVTGMDPESQIELKLKNLLNDI
jgi:hypothetical protein